jgi:hypothetical protein
MALCNLGAECGFLVGVFIQSPPYVLVHLFHRGSVRFGLIVCFVCLAFSFLMVGFSGYLAFCLLSVSLGSSLSIQLS